MSFGSLPFLLHLDLPIHGSRSRLSSHKLTYAPSLTPSATRAVALPTFIYFKQKNDVKKKEQYAKTRIRTGAMGLMGSGAFPSLLLCFSRRTLTRSGGDRRESRVKEEGKLSCSCSVVPPTQSYPLSPFAPAPLLPLSAPTPRHSSS